ncbi:MAG: NmrA family NAD(P)-binding protein [Oculatellaceae cyanobacterium bins.114]|nr:NmrA family NAD(P)-binding protein [Oculatellaceae cyanobacterium bins.114]
MVRLGHRPKILVTGATGKTGSAVVAQLLEKGFPVRAIGRSRNARSQRLERLGAETVVADLFDVDQISLVPFTPGYNFQQFERETLYPVQSQPQFVMSSDRWRAEHATY